MTRNRASDFNIVNSVPGILFLPSQNINSLSVKEFVMSYSSSPVMLAGYPCRILRTSQKSTTLRVDSDGTLRIRTNRRVSNQQLERFVRAHEDWIRQAREKAGTAAQQPLENTIRLLGEPWEIRTGSLCRGEHRSPGTADPGVPSFPDFCGK